MSDWPHVTGALKGAGLIDTEFIKPEYMARGTAVHLATQLWDEEDLDLESVDPVTLPRLEQWMRFRRDIEPEILAIEESVRNESYRYQGTLDRRLKIHGVDGILDIKGSDNQARWHGPQLAAYAACFDRPLARWSLYLSDTAYRLVLRKDLNDWTVFLAALTLHNWLEAGR